MGAGQGIKVCYLSIFRYLFPENKLAHINNNQKISFQAHSATPVEPPLPCCCLSRFCDSFVTRLAICSRINLVPPHTWYPNTHPASGCQDFAL